MVKTRYLGLAGLIARLMPTFSAVEEVGGGNSAIAAAGTGAEAGAATTTTAAGAGVGAADVDALITAALAKQHAEFVQQLKATTGHDSLQAIKEADMKAKGQLEELVLAKTRETEALKARLNETLITNALIAHAGNAIDPGDVAIFLASQATVDESGHVSVGGKSAADAIKELLAKKPHWAKPQGAGGSGAPAGGGSTAGMARAQFEALSPSARMDFIKKGGKVTENG